MEGTYILLSMKCKFAACCSTFDISLGAYIASLGALSFLKYLC